MCGGVCVVFEWSGFVVMFVRMVCIKCVWSVGCGCSVWCLFVRVVCVSYIWCGVCTCV